MFYEDKPTHGPDLEHPSVKCFILYKSKALSDVQSLYSCKQAKKLHHQQSLYIYLSLTHITTE